MNIPKEVAKIYSKPEFVCDFKDYQVFCENYGEDCPSIGMPEFLLFKDGKTRYADEKEIHEIMKSLPDD